MFNGHKNWNHWNVALWIANDEGLYNLAKDCKHNRNNTLAAKLFLSTLDDAKITKTPDGAPYSFTTVLAALRGLD